MRPGAGAAKFLGLAIALALGALAGCDFGAFWAGTETAAGPCPRGARAVERVDLYGHRRQWCELRLEGGPLEHGPWIAWHPSGGVSAQGQMRDGKPVGVWNFWSKSGALIESIDYSDGHPNPGG